MLYQSCITAATVDRKRKTPLVSHEEPTHFRGIVKKPELSLLQFKLSFWFKINSENMKNIKNFLILLFSELNFYYNF